uniref:Potassium channel domain-containing protein n=1 Tax=Zooxanthella nutricula TaxID=1333877 RepID=A0A7S2LKX4_9DINO
MCCDRRGSPRDFPSIAASFWWSIVTMTTVGYGDVYPRSLVGRIVGCLAMISGIVLISLPVAIVGSKFQQGYEDMERAREEQRELQEKEENATPDVPPRVRNSDLVFKMTHRLAKKAKAIRERVQPHEALRNKLRLLEGRRKLSMAAKAQIPLILEMLEHINKVDRQLAKLRQKDAALDKMIRKEVVAMARCYGAHVFAESKAQ